MSSPFAPYAEQHQTLNGPGDKRPTAIQVLEDNNLLQAWQDKVVLITGASSGIGIETARAMYATGARVFVMVRSAEKMQPIVADIIASVKGTGHIEIIEMDLDSLDSVRNAVKQFLAKSTQLNVLILNAAIMACPASTTVEGFERHFGVNYLAHFTLTNLLIPTLLSSSSSSSTPSFKSRVIWVSSTAHRFGAESFDFETIGKLDKDNYNPGQAYSHSKLAMVWASNYLDRKYNNAPHGQLQLLSLAVHPGGVPSNLTRYASADQLAKWMTNEELMRHAKSLAQGAATQVWAAAAPVWEGQKGGRYLSDVSIAGPCAPENMRSIFDHGYGPLTYDQTEKEDRLWKLSLQMAGLEDVEAEADV